MSIVCGLAFVVSVGSAIVAVAADAVGRKDGANAWALVAFLSAAAAAAASAWA